MRFRQPPIVLVNAALGLVVLAGAGWAYALVGGSSPSAASSTGARVVTVSQGSVVATVSAAGSVQSANTATADFTTAGTVTSIAVRVGAAIKKGQVLAKVDPTDAEAALTTAVANRDAAKASLTRANTTGDAATIAAAQAQVTAAEATVSQAARALDGTVLKAPMTGIVTAINGSVGGSSNGGSSSGASSSGAAAGSGSSGNGSSGVGSSGSGSSGSGGSSSGFIQLANVTTMQVSASFAEADATKLKTGQVANVTWAALTGATATAKIANIAPTATTSNNVNSYAVTATLDSLPSGVRIGQTVTISVTVGQAQDTVRVPAAAVRTVGNRHTVTVVISGQGQTRTVEVGVEGDTFTQITSGLNVGDQVEIVVQNTTSTTNNGGFRGGGGVGGGGLGGGGVGGGGLGGGLGGAGGGGRG